MKNSRKMKVAIVAVAVSILLISAGVYYLKIRPDAAKDFKNVIYLGMNSLNDIMMDFSKNKTPSNAENLLEKASHYFGIAARDADTLLISSEPYSKLSEITKILSEKTKKNKDFIYAMWNVWNRSDMGSPFRTIYSWINECYHNDTLWDFVDDMKNTNWELLINFLQEMEVNG